MKKEKKVIGLSRVEKILITLFDLSDGKKRNIRFEDLVVALFKKYPDHFHLKGYSEFPDSESVNNALYHNLKKKGLISYGNKVFSLTDRGFAVTGELKEIVNGKIVQKIFRFPKFVEGEIRRIKSLDGFRLFLRGNLEKILDTDFYNYFGVSVRTEKNEFLGRLSTMHDLIEVLQKKSPKDRIDNELINYHKFIVSKFKDMVDYYQKD